MCILAATASDLMSGLQSVICSLDPDDGAKVGRRADYSADIRAVLAAGNITSNDLQLR